MYQKSKFLNPSCNCIYIYIYIEGLIPQRIQLQAQVTIASPCCRHTSGECSNSRGVDPVRFDTQDGEVPLLVC